MGAGVDDTVARRRDPGGVRHHGLREGGLRCTTGTLGCSHSDDSWRWNGTASRPTRPRPIPRCRAPARTRSADRPPRRPRRAAPGRRRGRGTGPSFQLAGMRPGGPSCDPEAMLRCLIVDDSPRFLDAARGLLEGHGVTVVRQAPSSAEALRRAEELRPDVTLLDIDLGGESGLELARRLQYQAGPA